MRKVPEKAIWLGRDIVTSVEYHKRRPTGNSQVGKEGS